MIVKNIDCNEEIKLRCLDYIIRFLINKNISYVLIDNYELHFDNYILRFNLKENYFDTNEIDMSFDIYDEFLINASFNITKCYVINDKIDKVKKQEQQKLNKKLIKEQNRYYKNKLKRYRGV